MRRARAGVESAGVDVRLKACLPPSLAGGPFGHGFRLALGHAVVAIDGEAIVSLFSAVGPGHDQAAVRLLTEPEQKPPIARRSVRPATRKEPSLSNCSGFPYSLRTHDAPVVLTGKLEANPVATGPTDAS